MRRAFCVFGVLLLVTSVVDAGAPEPMSFVGTLPATSGPVNGDVEMVLRVFDAPVDGRVLLIDRRTGDRAVRVTGGQFGVTIGEGMAEGQYFAASLASHQDIWVEVEVAGEVLSPRHRLELPAMMTGPRGADMPATRQFVAAPRSIPDPAVQRPSPKAGGPFGLDVTSAGGGGKFTDADDGGYAEIATGGLGVLGTGVMGVQGIGVLHGAYFENAEGSSVQVASGAMGLYAISALPGFFVNSTTNATVALAPSNTGVQGFGSEAGGYFADSDSTSSAFVARGGIGIEASGQWAGGLFLEAGGSGDALIASGDWGVDAQGNVGGGRFVGQWPYTQALLAWDNRGIAASGTFAGGSFSAVSQSGLALVATGDRGIWAKGLFAGGTFSHPDDVTFWADVAKAGPPTQYKIVGTGAVSFVQNHPWERDRVVVYAAPEGDEVAVYTRGSARLTDGEARVALGETFALVANPDLGLTAHLTPRGEPVPLAIVRVDTSELVVRGPAGSDAAFDYLVWGLRIGFEEHTAVQPKERDAFLPERAAIDSWYAAHPELRRFTPLDRFREMRTAIGEPGEVDLGRTHELIAAIDADREAVVEAARAGLDASFQAAGTEVHPRSDHEASPEPRATTTSPVVDTRPAADSPAEPRADPPVVLDRPVTWLPVAEPVEEGDVLAFDPERPGVLRRASAMAAPGVVGIAAGEQRASVDGGLEAPMADARYVVVKADAGYGAIRPGDLLVASPTPGHAMRPLQAVTPPGTVLGKALDGLEVGAGAIRMVLMLH